MGEFANSLATPENSVTAEEIGRLWAMLRCRVASVEEGVLGPSSVSWKVNRESALFLGAGRASLLQLAHPWVAAALEDHSNIRTDPLGRFHRTFRVVFTMVFGTLDQALKASKYLYNLHTRIQGSLPEAVASYSRGSHYQANDRSALLWVYVTLIESAVVAYEAVLPPLTVAEREAYYAESRLVAALFGIAPEALPADWAGLESYFHSMLGSGLLGASGLSRELAERILHGSGSWVPVPRWYRCLTAEWLPEQWREDFRLAHGPGGRSCALKAVRRISRIYRHLPGAVRYVGPYHEAVARLSRSTPGLLTRWNNRFWMGQPGMMFPSHPPSRSIPQADPLRPPPPDP